MKYLVLLIEGSVPLHYDEREGTVICLFTSSEKAQEATDSLDIDLNETWLTLKEIKEWCQDASIQINRYTIDPEYIWIEAKTVTSYKFD